MAEILNPVVESVFDHKGYRCAVLFNPIGFRAGYVGVPKGHPYYWKKYDDIPIDCHGGLTYSRPELIGQDEKDIWWIGFDCGHYGDAYDFDSLEKYFPENSEFFEYWKKNYFPKEYETLKTKELVEEECRYIADQLELIADLCDLF